MVLMYIVTYEILKNAKIAFLTAILFTLSPSSVFYNSLYTENLFCFLNLMSLYFYSQVYSFMIKIYFKIKVKYFLL